MAADAANGILLEILQEAGLRSSDIFNKTLDRLEHVTKDTKFSKVAFINHLSLLEQCIDRLSDGEILSQFDELLRLIKIPFVRECIDADNTIIQILEGLCGKLSKCPDTFVCRLIDEVFIDLVNLHCEQQVKKSHSLSGHKVEGGKVNISLLLFVLKSVLQEITTEIATSLALSLDALFKVLLFLLRVASSNLCHFICSTILPHFLTIPEHAVARKQLLWRLICQLTELQDEAECGNENLVNTLLCCLVEFLSVKSASSKVSQPADSLDLRKENSFWEILQRGLTATDSLNRKRSLFLLHYCVTITAQDEVDTEFCSPGAIFWWHPDHREELKAIWDDFLLLVQTMEEKQVHIVKPVLPRLSNLIEAVHKNVRSHRCLHVSWLTVVFSRIFAHDAKNIVKWGVRGFLNMELEGSPLLFPSNWKFVLGRLFSVLCQSTVIGRDSELPSGSCPTVITSFQNFLPKFVQSLQRSEKGNFVLQFLKECKEQSPGDMALCYFTQSLSLIQPQPILGAEGLLIMRTISSQLLTFQVLLRSSIQCFLLQAAIRLVSVEEVTFQEIALFLSALKPSECLAYKSLCWRETEQWIDQVSKVQFQNFGSDIRNFILEAVKKLMSSHYKREDTRTSSSYASHLARLALLSVHQTTVADQTTESREGWLLSVLCPVLDIIVQASTRVYLSAIVVNNALEFLSAFLDNLKSVEHLASPPRGWDCDDSLIYRSMEGHVDGVMQYCMDQIFAGSKNPPEPDLEHVTFFCNVLQKMYWFITRNSSSLQSLHRLIDSGISSAAEELKVFSDKSKSTFLTGGVLGAVAIVSWLSELGLNCSEVGEGKEGEGEPGKLSGGLTRTQALQLSNLALGIPPKPSFEKVDSRNKLGIGIEPSLAVDGMRASIHAQRQVNPLGPLVAHALVCIWKGYHFALLTRGCEGGKGNEDIDAIELFKELSDCLDTASGRDIAVLLKSLALLVPEVMKTNPQLLLEKIQVIWPLILEIKDNVQFHAVTCAFVALAFHPKLLICCHDIQDSVMVVLQQLFTEVLDVGEVHTGCFNILVSQICKQWLSAAARGVTLELKESLVGYFNVIVEGCTFGQLQKRSIRPQNDVEEYVASLGGLTTNELKLMYKEGDTHVRLTVLSFLMELLSFGKDSHCLWIMETFLSRLMDTLIEKDIEVSGIRARYFPNSIFHRIKFRLWQVILVLIPFVSEVQANWLISKLFKALGFDNQISVKHTIEWASTLLILNYPKLVSSLLAILDYTESDAMIRPACILSFISISFHVFFHWQNQLKMVSANHLIMRSWLKWTQSHHFNARTYAQTSLARTWEELRTNSEMRECYKDFEILNELVPFMKKHGECGKFEKKLQTNLFFSQINAKSDWNVECVLHHLPLLTGMSPQEVTSLDDLLAVSPFWGKQNLVRLNSNNSKLNEMVENYIAVEDTEACEEEYSTEGDVQRKVAPWTDVEELFPKEILRGIYNQKGKAPNGLILVASLVTKATNLGGLSRTCEIFGVSEMVISNSNILQDELFQKLSVTSEKWLNMSEVRAPDLPDYLLCLKRQGFTLVGVEQTAQSKTLLSYKFSKNTVLVLGSERTGIPVGLIHHLDECIEIPQCGFVRSLNVHVSGALAIWEYAKQYLILS